MALYAVLLHGAYAAATAECPAGSTYDECGGCHRTCDDHMDLSPCLAGCRRGCYCSHGTVWEDHTKQKCVTIDQCLSHTESGARSRREVDPDYYYDYGMDYDYDKYYDYDYDYDYSRTFLPSPKPTPTPTTTCCLDIFSAVCMACYFEISVRSFCTVSPLSYGCDRYIATEVKTKECPQDYIRIMDAFECLQAMVWLCPDTCVDRTAREIQEPERETLGCFRDERNQRVWFNGAGEQETVNRNQALFCKASWL